MPAARLKRSRPKSARSRTTIAIWLAAPRCRAPWPSVAEAAGKDHQKEIHPDDNLELDLGLDSMERVELLTDLAHRLGAEVEDSAASEVYTRSGTGGAGSPEHGQNRAPGAGLGHGI